MASIAPTNSRYKQHRVAPLPRMGAILLVLLVTAAGIAPIIPWGSSATTIDTGAGMAISQPASAKDKVPLSLSNGFQVSEPPAAETLAVDSAEPAAAIPETVAP